MLRIAVLMATYNRCPLTDRILKQLTSTEFVDAELRIYITDGGSTDETCQMIATKYLTVHLEIRHNLYWNQAMRNSWNMSLNEEIDFFLWLNDDVLLRDDWLAYLINFCESINGRSVIVGKLEDPYTKLQSYGGYRSIKHLGAQLRLRRLHPEEVTCDTMNGNVVLIPFSVFKDVGMLDSKFSHYWGDIEYGFRLTLNDVPIYETDQFIGYLELNHESMNKKYIGSWKEFHLLISHPKGIPVKEWLYFCRKFGGVLWPLHFMAHMFHNVTIRK